MTFLFFSKSRADSSISNYQANLWNPWSYQTCGWLVLHFHLFVFYDCLSAAGADHMNHNQQPINYEINNKTQNLMFIRSHLFYLYSPVSKTAKQRTRKR